MVESVAYAQLVIRNSIATAVLLNLEDGGRRYEDVLVRVGRRGYDLERLTRELIVEMRRPLLADILPLDGL